MTSSGGQKVTLKGPKLEFTPILFIIFVYSNIKLKLYDYDIILGATKKLLFKEILIYMKIVRCESYNVGFYCAYVCTKV